eukprot:TRINITY_DN1002_c2_g2_i1.p1 TRINITY_DN1002_c2_g2~~TRINITY_DN1002_c2_g2_i1.p1  ORF type:complete len:277 (+),score=63.43 TRINITY_DN1002_c2_g2_i1:65-895(+)
MPPRTFAQVPARRGWLSRSSSPATPVAVRAGQRLPRSPSCSSPSPVSSPPGSRTGSPSCPARRFGDLPPSAPSPVHVRAAVQRLQPRSASPQRPPLRGPVRAARPMRSASPAAPRSVSQRPAARARSATPSAVRCPWEAELPAWDADLAASGKLGSAQAFASDGEWAETIRKDSEAVEDCIRHADRLAGTAARFEDRRRKCEEAMGQLNLRHAPERPGTRWSPTAPAKQLFGQQGIQGDCADLVASTKRIVSVSGRVEDLLRSLEETAVSLPPVRD